MVIEFFITFTRSVGKKATGETEWLPAFNCPRCPRDQSDRRRECSGGDIFTKIKSGVENFGLAPSRCACSIVAWLPDNGSARVCRLSRYRIAGHGPCTFSPLRRAFVKLSAFTAKNVFRSMT